MYLLKHCKLNPADKEDSLFTFHYVSIKTFISGDYQPLRLLFTFHYVSIKTVVLYRQDAALKNLHSTMYLLKHKNFQGKNEI